MSYVMLGGLSSQDRALAEVRYSALKARIVAANAPRIVEYFPLLRYERPISEETLDDNLERLDRAFRNALAGDMSQVVALEQKARNILEAIKDPEDNASIAGILAEVLAILKRGARAAAGLARDLARDVLGVDPDKVGFVIDAVPWIAGIALVAWVYGQTRR